MFFGGLSIKKDEEVLKRNCPHVVVGTPGRILALVRNKSLILKNVKHFVLDECDKMLEQLGEPLLPAPAVLVPCSLAPQGVLCTVMSVLGQAKGTRAMGILPGAILAPLPFPVVQGTFRVRLQAFLSGLSCSICRHLHSEP